MRFSWIGLILAPLPVPALASAAMAILGSDHDQLLGFLILLVPGCVVSYGTTIFLFLPSLFVASVYWRMTGFRVCLLGAVLGMLVFVPLTWLIWTSSGNDSGPPTESFFVFLPRWTADPLTAIFPLAGLLTAGAYWWLGSRQRGVGISTDVG